MSINDITHVKPFARYQQDVRSGAHESSHDSFSGISLFFAGKAVES